MKLYDVWAVNIETGDRRLIKSGIQYDDAEAVVNMAVMRRGVEEEFFKTEPATASGEQK